MRKLAENQCELAKYCDCWKLFMFQPTKTSPSIGHIATVQTTDYKLQIRELVEEIGPKSVRASKIL